MRNQPGQRELALPRCHTVSLRLSMAHTGRHAHPPEYRSMVAINVEEFGNATVSRGPDVHHHGLRCSQNVVHSTPSTVRTSTVTLIEYPTGKAQTSPITVNEPV